jgi:hypothetical protein
MNYWKTEIFNVMTLADLITNRSILIPQYQRGQIWSAEQKDALVDSIKNGFPFGTILLYKQSDDNYVLIDGLQRSSTIHEFVNNPSQFFNEKDLIIEDLIAIANTERVDGVDPIDIDKIKEAIMTWVKNLNNMQKVVQMQYANCAVELHTKFPRITPDKIMYVANLLQPSFRKFIEMCQDLVNADIPAIVYSGDASNLPLIFERINSKGTKLSKYQIFAATWSTLNYRILDQPLFRIVENVKKHFDALISKSFNIDDYDPENLLREKQINLYQLLYGFGKLISENFPILFKSRTGTEVDSIGFNLVNACVLNSNNNMKNLPLTLRAHFKSDEEINLLLLRIIESCEIVNAILRPISEFKLNSRTELTKTNYHSEMQICSLISSVFLNRYVEFSKNEDGVITSAIFNLNEHKTSWNNYYDNFKANSIRVYVNDILTRKWAGTGDKKLDDIIKNVSYYTTAIADSTLESAISSWIDQSNLRNEIKKVAEPTLFDKLLLSIIYKNKLSAGEQLDGSHYDIEHLIPKELLKSKLKNCDASAGLPISSFANICILPEYINRKKKSKTIYQDSDYIKSVNHIPNMDLRKLEEKYTFTKKSDMKWVEKSTLNYSELSINYRTFLKARKARIIKEILQSI